MESEEQLIKEIRGVEGALFAWLLAYPRAWSLAEVRAEFGPAGEEAEEHIIVSAVSRLRDSGLAHWRGDYVIPTLAAIRADELAS